jgi:hypothetical protein
LTIDGWGNRDGKGKMTAPRFHRDGSVYVTRCDVVLDRNSLYGDRLVGYVVDDRACVNIDRLPAGRGRKN